MERGEVVDHLREHVARVPLVREGRLHAERVEGRGRFDVPEVAQIDAGHGERDDEAVVLGDEGHRDPRLVQRFLELAPEVLAPIATGRELVDPHDGIEVVCAQVADARRHLLERLVGRGERHAVDFALQERARREQEAGSVEELEEPVVAPVNLGDHVPDPACHALPAERAHEVVTDADVLRCGRDPDGLEQDRRLGTPILARGDAREDEPDQPRGARCGDLQVRLGVADRRGEPALEIPASRAPDDAPVQRDDSTETAIGSCLGILPGTREH